MSKELADIQDLKTAFISYCRELGCGELYIQVCENKFRGIEAALKILERDFEITKIYIDEFGWVYCEKIDENGNMIDIAVYENFLPDKSYAKTCKVYETLDLLSAHLKIDEIESDYPPIKTELLLKEYLK